MKRSERTALVMLGAILVITAVWWALALWPTAQAAPAWLERTRSVCFGTKPDGLPDAYGWLVLTGQPLAMLLILFFGWGRDVAGGLRSLSRSGVGRVALAFSAIVIVVALGAVGARLQGASSAFAASGEMASASGARDGAASAAVAEVVRLDREPPRLELIDQRSDVVSLQQFRGRPVLVTFAFGHCEAICPTVVRDVLAARRELAESGINAAAIVVSLDPWRDTPSRLPYIAERWEMGDDEFLLSADVGSVEETLDAWEVGRRRDGSTGDIIHPRLIYLVDANGRLVGATSGSVSTLIEMIRSP